VELKYKNLNYLLIEYHVNTNVSKNYY